MPGGRCIRHAPQAAPDAVRPLVVTMIEPAGLAALMPRVGGPPLLPLRLRAAGLPAVRLASVAGSADEEYRPALRPAAPERVPPYGRGHGAGPGAPGLREGRGQVAKRVRATRFASLARRASGKTDLSPGSLPPQGRRGSHERRARAEATAVQPSQDGHLDTPRALPVSAAVGPSSK